VIEKVTFGIEMFRTLRFEYSLHLRLVWHVVCSESFNILVPVVTLIVKSDPAPDSG
jgi:hypothetical protein